MGQIQVTLNKAEFIDKLEFISDKYNLIKNIELKDIPINKVFDNIPKNLSTITTVAESLIFIFTILEKYILTPSFNIPGIKLHDKA